MIIGICGKSCSGKSTLSRIMASNHENATLLDIDKIGHQALTIEEVKEKLVKCFGSELLNEQGIDRKILSKIVFSSPTKMNKLSDITWSYMEKEIDKFISEHRDNIIILDWLLLPITKYFSVCDMKILIDIPYEIRKMRAIKRDNITESEFDLRDKASITFNNSDFDLAFKDNNEEQLKRLVMSI